MKKLYLSAQQLLEDSWRLGARILDSGFEPNWLLGIWRGGTPVAIAIHELFVLSGREIQHNCIKTAFYTGINKTDSKVAIEGLAPILDQIGGDDRVLLVDDVFDTGKSLAAVIRYIHDTLGEQCPEVRIATPWYKPDNNQTDILPDYYLHQTDNWLVFPHELAGLDKSELFERKPGADVLKQILAP